MEKKYAYFAYFVMIFEGKMDQKYKFFCIEQTQATCTPGLIRILWDSAAFSSSVRLQGPQKSAERLQRMQWSFFHAVQKQRVLQLLPVTGRYRHLSLPPRSIWWKDSREEIPVHLRKVPGREN